MTTPAEDSEPTRAQLERVAFGRAETPAEIAAAQDALRRLVETDAASVAIERETAAHEVEPEPDVVDDAHEVETPVPVRRRRTLVPLLIVVGLFAGAAIGVLVTRSEPVVPIGSEAAASATPTPAPTPDPTAAFRLLLVPQTKADKAFPLPISSGPSTIQSASIHRVLSTPDGATLWVGRSDTGICLMWSRAHPTDDGIAGGVTCAAPSAFARHGLTLSDGANTWSWNGIAFTTTMTD
jgi:hypothetical protein